MKSLKYEGMVKLKIFWRLRRLEAGLSDFKSKRVHYGRLELQIILNHLISPQPNTPSLLPQQKHFGPPLHSKRVAPSLPFHHFSSSSHLSNRPILPKSFLISVHLFLFFIEAWSWSPIRVGVCVSVACSHFPAAAIFSGELGVEVKRWVFWLSFFFSTP